MRRGQRGVTRRGVRWPTAGAYRRVDGADSAASRTLRRREGRQTGSTQSGGTPSISRVRVSSPAPRIHTRTVRDGSSGSTFSAHSIAVRPAPSRISSRPSARISPRLSGTVEIHVVQRQASRVLGDQDEGRARHGTLDAKPSGETLDEAGLPCPEVADERHHGSRGRAAGDPGGDRPRRVRARAAERDRHARRAGTGSVHGRAHAQSESRTCRIAAGMAKATSPATRPALPRASAATSPARPCR